MKKLLCLAILITSALMSSCAGSQSPSQMTDGIKDTTTALSTTAPTGDNMTTTNAEDPEPIVPPTYTPEQDVSGTYLMKDARDLRWLSNFVNNSSEPVSKDFSVRLENDIDMSEITNWTPIGKDGLSVFKGTFDGNGKTLKNLTVKKSEGSEHSNYIALIGIAHDATVKNLNVEDFYLEGDNFVAGICASSGGVIENCSAKVTIKGKTSVGAVCGFNSGIMINCSSSGEVIGSANMVGGVCGYSYNAAIENCQNSAKVSGESWVGGICGYSDKGSILKSQNSGEIVSQSYAAGICGRFDASVEYSYVSGNLLHAANVNDADKGHLFDCVNTGNVTAYAQSAGGICGLSNAYVYNCSNSGRVVSETYASGISSEAHFGALKAVKNSGEICGKKSSAGIVAHSHVPVVMAENSGKIISEQGRAAGICESLNGSVLVSCLSLGEVEAPSELSGVLTEGFGSLIGCVFSGKLTATAELTNVSTILSKLGSGEIIINDCYAIKLEGIYASPETVQNPQIYELQEEALLSGEIVYMLSQLVNEDKVCWELELGNEKLPTLGENNGLCVYKVTEYNSCHPNISGVYVYSNKNEDIFTPHSYVDGVCSECGKTE